MGASPIPPIFEEITGHVRNRLVDEALSAGRRAVGYTCSYIPEPLLSVDGLFPLRLRAPGVAGTPMADTYLSSVLCGYVRSLLELTLEARFDFLAGWVFASSCDHLRRLYDNVAYLMRPSFNVIVDLPHKTGDPALAWWIDELRRLADALEAHFGVDVGPDALRAAIARHNGHIAELRAIGDLRRREAPPISGTDFHRLLVACATAPKDLLAGALAELAEGLSGQPGIRDYRARLMVFGSQIDDPAYLGIIESMGGLVVADRFCFGSLPQLVPIPEADDPLEALAAHSLRKTPCPRMMEAFDERVEEALRVVEAFAVDGVVLETMKFCDTWGVESSPLVDALRRADVPVLRLEREYALTGEGQMRTRVQAFLESMGR